MAEKRRKNGDGVLIKNPSGSFSIRKRYQIGDKITRKCFTGKTQSEAKKKMQQFENEHRLNPNYNYNQEILCNYMENWAKLYKSKSVKATTYDTIDATISRIKKYDIAFYQLNQLNSDKFQYFFHQLVEDKYSLETIKKTYNHINACLKKAESKGDINKNPLSDVELPSEENVLTKSKNIQIFDDDDIKKIYLEAYRTSSNGKYKYQHGAAIVFMLYTGLRIGECIGLKWENVDMDKKCIYVDTTVSIVKDRENGGYKENISTTKTKKSTRTVPLSNKAIEALEIAKQQNTTPSIVFQSETGTRINARNVSRCLESILTNAGTKLEQAGLHALRHTFASKLIRKKVDIKIISELLGHKKVSTTYDIYAHLIEGETQMAISVLDE